MASKGPRFEVMAGSEDDIIDGDAEVVIGDHGC
jgi:hypothetical protein